MTPITALRELAHRTHDGLVVTLLWDPRSNEISIDLVDERNDCSFSVGVPAHAALDAFDHPYIYAPAWLELNAPTPREPAVAEG